MKVVVVISTLLVLVASKALENRDLIDLESNSAYGYLTKVGLPLATKIREAEAQATAVRKIRAVPGDRIINGAVAHLGDIPYQAGLIVDFELGESVCGGSLLNKKRVLTAAHCWWDGKRQASSLTVVLGSVKLFTGGIRQQTSNVVMHSKWNPQQFSNDIAMIYLPNPVKFSTGIKPIALPSGRDLQEDFTEHQVIASGFGLTRDDDQITSRAFLSHVQLQVISNRQCSQTYAIVQPAIICTKSIIHENICGGDSGGPLAVKKDNKYILVGVTSFGNRRSCEERKPAGYTRVTSYIDWIKNLL